MIKKIKKLLIKLILVLLIPFIPPTYALKADKDQSIDITADQLEMNEAEHFSVYTGNVVLQQGSLKITAESLVLYFDQNNELDYMEMKGVPALLKQQNDDLKWMNGSANHIIYKDKESLLTLRINGEFLSGKEHITSDYIKINLDNDQIQAGLKDANKRVHMKILPRSKK